MNIPPKTSTTYKRVLITGAAGNIGHVLREELSQRYPVLRLSDIASLGDARQGEEVMEADITDYPAMLNLMEGVDAVIHLGGSADGRDWDTICKLNLMGARNVFEAARQKGVKRIIFASSNHAMGMYPITEALSSQMPPRPDTYYGISKAYAESMLRYYVDKYGMSAVCLRIGSFQPEPQDARQLMTWISHRDMVQLVWRSLEHQDLAFEVALGFSGNKTLKTDDPGARKIGYQPKDDAEVFRDALRKKGLDVDGPIPYPLLGGPYTDPTFDIP